MKLGILPGTFNPPTRAHLALARAALSEVDQVLFVLPRVFPHKSYDQVGFEERRAMLQAAIESEPRSSIATSEGGLFIDIARECRAAYPPGTRLIFLCGRDAAERIVNWDYGEAGAFAKMLQEFELLVAPRDGPYQPPEELRARIHPLACDCGVVSATEVRERIRRGERWEHLVPESIVPTVRANYGDFSSPPPRVPRQKGILPTMPNQPLPVSPMKDPVTWLYPPIEPYNTGRLQVSPVHEIYFEESGNPSGKPVIFLHGGPGGGSDPKQRRFFHPEKYRIVNFDQRGCGKSTPYASLEANTTWDLVADIEKIREHLGIERWQVFGGSWGSTLALAYSQTHPDRVTELILRGIFLLRKQEIDWFYQRGASVLYPDAWEPYLAHIPEAERGDLLAAYHRRLTSDDPAVRLAAAKIWSGWEGATSKLLPDSTFAGHYEEDEFALAFARIEVHYFFHRGFFETDDQLLSNASRIRRIPGVIVQGRYDVVCPMESAWALHRAWPEADLIITPDSGHSAFDPPNSRALVAATDKFTG